MPNCPECKEEIAYLDYESHKVECGTFDVGGNFEDDYLKERRELVFLCPECGEVLYNNEGEANEFLKGD